MSGIGKVEITAHLAPYGGFEFDLLEVGSPPHPLLPASWLPVMLSPHPEERKQAALSTWNEDFLDVIPRFAVALESKLVDVRAITVPDEEDPRLVYWFGGANDPYDSHELWIGWSPATFGDRAPTFFDTLPDPARKFLREVHAGFSLYDGESFGLTPPRYMQTIAEYAQEPDGIPDWEGNGWEDCEPIDSRRLLRVTGSNAHYSLLTSPDLPTGKAITHTLDGAEMEVVCFFEELDRLMYLPLDTA